MPDGPKKLQDPAALIQRNLDEWETPCVELDIFGTGSAGRIAEIVDAFCREHLGSRLAGYLFCTTSVGSTHGVHLEDGREVVIKARPPQAANPHMKHDRESLESVFSVTQWLHARAYPCPRPVLGPTRLAKGLATVEEYFVRGERGDASQPGCRKTIAAALAELIALLRRCEIDVNALRPFPLGDALYPQPHGRIFNLRPTGPSRTRAVSLRQRISSRTLRTMKMRADGRFQDKNDNLCSRPASTG